MQGLAFVLGIYGLFVTWVLYVGNRRISELETKLRGSSEKCLKLQYSLDSERAKLNREKLSLLEMANARLTQIAELKHIINDMLRKGAAESSPATGDSSTSEGGAS